jgi:hypothetical protein
MTATLTPRERSLARHALGLAPVLYIKRKRPFRNRFDCYSENSDEFRDWMSLAKRGLAGVWLRKNCFTFYVTRAGALAALEEGETLDEEDFPR